MNQYCYNIIFDTELDNLDVAKVKSHIQKMYRKKKFGDFAFVADEKLPFIVLYSKKDVLVCIKMTSRAKKNIERIEDIHSKLKAIDLKVNSEIKLEKPYLFQLEQCAWWDEECKVKVGEQQKWSTLSHNGPYFTHLMEPYEPHGASLIYDEEEYELTPKEERVANFYAQRIISESSGNVAQIWTNDTVFNKNFWMDFKKYLTVEHKKIFKYFSKVDFSLIVERLQELKDDEKEISQKEKDFKKIKTAERKQDYGYAIINGIKEPVANFTIEPAAIFYGRGKNPKRGKIKRDIEPKEVTINVGEGVKVTPPPGHKWKQVIHDHNAAWIANWKDPISNENKYVYLGAEGQLKGKSDFVKYEKARKLNKYIGKVRTKYTKDIKSNFDKSRQLGTVLYLIDNYGLRVGNEKDESETDTVGASTLRVEHVKLKDPDIVIFDFLGKDSIRYYKEIPVSKGVYDNFVDFLSSKKPSDPVFDLINAADINSYLKTFDKDFSAKVFRTRLASTVMDDSLKQVKVKKTATSDDKKKLFTKVNIQVAEILNHRRTVPPKSKETIKKYQQELKELRKNLRETKEAGKSTKALETRIKKKRDQITTKKDTLNIAITTSLTNYIDPRIVVGWAKMQDMSIPKVYSAVLQRKFKWAIDLTDEDWDYENTALLPAMAKLAPGQPSVPAKKAPVKKPLVKKAPVKKTLVKKAPVKTLVKKAPVPTVDTFTQSELPSPLYDVSIINYSEKSIIVIGNTKPYLEYLKAIGGKFSKGFTVFGAKVPGWVFSKKKLQEVQDVLLEAAEEEILVKEKKTAKSKGKTLDDIMTDHKLTNKEKNIIRCFGRDPNVVNFLKQELTGWDVGKKIFNEAFLARFLSCLESYNKSETVQKLALKKYQSKSYSTLSTEIVSKLQPSTVPTFMFLLFILYKVSSRLRETYLQKLISHLSNSKDIQKCLCDNSEKDTLLGDPIKEVQMDELYLLPSGRCTTLDELIMHLKISANKIADPTYDKFKHGPTPDMVWTNGWELRAMLDRIQKYNYTKGAEIKQEFKKVIQDVTNKIPKKTKDLIDDTYFLFYFPEEGNNQKIIDTLVKYGYPKFEEGPGDKKAAAKIITKGSGPELNEFREMLGFKLGHHIMETLTPEQREAFLFAGEFVGMGKEAWGKLSMGEFCTKTFGTTLHRMAELFAGKWNI